MLSREVAPVMEVVLVIASMLLLASVAAAVALDRGPFAAPPPRPGTAGPLPVAHPEIPAAGRWVGHEASVRACDDLMAQLRSGRLSCAEYRRAMADVAASHDRRHPLPIPPEA
jgi:hypothetical protein